MTILQVQIFVILLGAFLLGAATACLFRRAFTSRTEEDVAAAVAAAGGPAAVLPAGASRFERALSGDPSNAVPMPFQSSKGRPVVEVQPIPAAEPPVVARAPEPPPPAAFEPVAPTPLVPAAPIREEPVVEEIVVEAEAEPAPSAIAPVGAAPPALLERVEEFPATEEPPIETAFEPEPLPERELEPEVAEATAEAHTFASLEDVAPAPHEPNYVEIALAANEAAGFAAHPKAPEHLQPESGIVDGPMPYEAPAPEPHHEPTYTEIAEAANAAAAALAAQAFAADALASQEIADIGPADDLTRIRTIDTFWQLKLNQLGVRTFSDIADWSEANVLRISQTLGFSGRIEEENWIGQAQILARGSAVEQGVVRTPEDVAATVAVPLASDSLHRIIGIDPATEAILIANGVTGVADIAAWTWQDVEAAEALIGKPGRVGLENWIEQARFLTRAGAPREHAPIGYAPEMAEPQPPVEQSAATPEPEPEFAPAFEAAPAPQALLEPEPARPALDESAPEVPAVIEAAASGSEARGDHSLTGLRSVRSEALLGDVDPHYVGGPQEDLKRIRGIGVLIERKLYSLGVTSYEQVANWTAADIARISDVLDFKGRIERENWVEQARILASGGQTEFSRRADRGEV